ncbi:MAG TPA: hypothetical protein VIL43_04915, partial [Burkholderiales bacterium]
FQAVFAGELSSRDRSLVATVARVLELHIQLGQHAHNSGDLADVKKLALEMRETVGFQKEGTLDSQNLSPLTCPLA